MRYIRLHMLWFLTSYRYHCFCPWGKQKGIYLYDFFVAPKNVAEVERLPNQESFSSSHCLRSHLSLLDFFFFFSFSPSLPLSHNFFYFFKNGAESGHSKKEPQIYSSLGSLETGISRFSTFFRRKLTWSVQLELSLSHGLRRVFLGMKVMIETQPRRP